MCVSNIVGKSISELRKELHITQADLAEKLMVNPQAVSQWEHSETFPDIMLLPDIAKIFGVTIDRLFGLTNQIEIPKDEKIRAVVFIGNSIVETKEIAKDITKDITFKYDGRALNVESWFDVIINGDINGSVSCDEIGGDVTGGTINVNCSGTIGGDITSRGDINITCKEVGGEIHADGNITINK